MRYITRHLTLLYFTLSECARICCIEVKNHLHTFYFACKSVSLLLWELLFINNITVPFSAVEFILCNLNLAAAMEPDSSVPRNM